mgnify:CR=1 FL=1
MQLTNSTKFGTSDVKSTFFYEGFEEVQIETQIVYVGLERTV